jgi:ribosomal protein L23
MEIDIHNVIIRQRSRKLNRSVNIPGVLEFEVHPQANKPLIKRALKVLFNAEVERIGTAIIKGKAYRMGKRKDKKKAFVTLKPGSEGGAMDWSSITSRGEESGAGE